MGSPTLYWGSQSVAIEWPLQWSNRRERQANVNRADSGVSETVLEDIYDAFTIAVDSFDSQSVLDKLIAWWAYAAQGNSYSFALDSADKVDTTITGNVSAGGTSVVVTSATGITIGNRYRLRDAVGVGFAEEIVTVSNVVGTTITIGALIYAHSAGALFRSIDYYPALETLDDAFPVSENPGLTWSMQHNCREARTP